MKYYIQFMLICLFAVIGEALSTFFKLPVPGSIIGLFLLLIALQLKWIRPRHIHAVAEFLIANMTILFLPAGVGIMERWNAISANITLCVFSKNTWECHACSTSKMCVWSVRQTSLKMGRQIRSRWRFPVDFRICLISIGSLKRNME